jgi:adenine-specific DNA-methyltransferase
MRHRTALPDTPENLTCPTTQSIKYAGSKRELLPHLLAMLQGLDVASVFDGFSGTTRVSQALAQRQYSVVCNDIADWSHTLGNCYLMNQQSPAYYADVLSHLNGLEGRHGWYSEHYGGQDFSGSAIQRDGLKRPWQLHNTRKLDAIRDEIDRLGLNTVEKATVLTSLMLALDEVDNTLGHFASYLRCWSPRSYKTMHLKVPRFCEATQKNTVLQGDIFEVAPSVNADFTYLDPPYGSNNEKMPSSRVRYAAYYHVWTTLCRHDKPDLFGAARRRSDSVDSARPSVFEDFRKDADGRSIAVKAIDHLISAINSRYVALSYSSGGKANAAELHDILKKHGTLLKTLELDYRKNIMAELKWTHQWLRETEKAHREFIFLLEKQ